MNGVLNLLCGGLGNICMRNIPPHTNTKAKRVPTLVKSITTFISKNKAGIATTTPVRIVEKEGVLNLGCMREKIGGNKPSRLILIHIRG